MRKIIIILLVLWFMGACNSSEPQADAYGNFESTSLYITPEIAGKILELTVDEGDKVNTGQVIALLDSTEVLIKLEQIHHQIQAVEAGLIANEAQAAVYDQQIANLETDQHRLANLLMDGSATQKQYDDVTAAIALAQKQKSAVLKHNIRIGAELKGLKSQADLLRLSLARCQVKSQSQGQVLNIYQRCGEIATPGKPILRMAYTDTLYLRAFASGDQLPRLQIGKKVMVQIDDGLGNLKSYDGMITWIAEEAEFTPKTIQTRHERVNLVYAFKVKVANDGSLKMGMPGEVLFTQAQ